MKASPFAVAEIRRVLAGPPCPPAAAHVMDWFRRLHALRDYDGSVPRALPPPWIEVWERRLGLRMAPWEFEALLTLDAAYRTIVTRDRAETTSPEAAILAELVTAARMAAALIPRTNEP